MHAYQNDYFNSMIENEEIEFVLNYSYPSLYEPKSCETQDIQLNCEYLNKN